MIPMERIAEKIYVIRGQRVMLDSDIAGFYGVGTKVLNQAVKRNMNRFPENFMFRLNYEEAANLRSQFVTSSWGGPRTLPFVFTEHGVVMLSSVLKSERAVQASIAVVNAFIRMREYLATQKQIIDKLQKHDENFVIIFRVLKQLAEKPKNEKHSKKFGFMFSDNYNSLLTTIIFPCFCALFYGPFLESASWLLRA